MSWQEAMFIEFADYFIEILNSKKLPGDIQEFFRSFCPSNENRMAVLDLGCGVGRLFRPLSDMSTVVIGLDYSQKLVSVAATNASELPNVSVICHDMRRLKELFPPKSFSLVVRAYTSLGYFEPNVEASILVQCAEIVEPNGILIVDTFNSRWFQVNQSFERKAVIGSFSLVEQYVWEPDLCKIRCNWIYMIEDKKVFEIPFSLDGYDVDRIDSLLATAGWCRESLFQDFSLLCPMHPPEQSERIVVVAKRQQ